MSVVSIVGHPDAAGNEYLYEMVLKTFDNINVDEIIHRGDTVLIKPNLADIRRVKYLPRTGDLTNRDIIEAVTRALRENTEAGELIIAEASATPTWELFLEWNLLDIAKNYHVRLVDLNFDESTNVRLEDGIVLKRVWVPRTIRKADVIISLPVLKVWNETAISMNIKNMAGGCLPRHYYKIEHIPCNLAQMIRDKRPQFNPEYLYGQSQTLSAVCVDLYSVYRADIGIIDARRVMHMKAPGLKIFQSEDAVRVDDLNLLIGSLDPVASDAVGVAIMSFNPQKIVHLNMAAKKGFGTNKLENITIKGINIEEVKIQCTPVAGMEAITT